MTLERGRVNVALTARGAGEWTWPTRAGSTSTNLRRSRRRRRLLRRERGRTAHRRAPRQLHGTARCSCDTTRSPARVVIHDPMLSLDKQSPESAGGLRAGPSSLRSAIRISVPKCVTRSRGGTIAHNSIDVEERVKNVLLFILHTYQTRSPLSAPVARAPSQSNQPVHIARSFEMTRENLHECSHSCEPASCDAQDPLLIDPPPFCDQAWSRTSLATSTSATRAAWCTCVIAIVISGSGTTGGVFWRHAHDPDP